MKRMRGSLMLLALALPATPFVLQRPGAHFLPCAPLQARQASGLRRGLGALSMAVGKTLVVGATGKVGGMVVRRLAAAGTPVVALARNVESAAAQELAALTNVELREGDVCDLAALKIAATGCKNMVLAHGMRPPRFPKISDLWSDPFDDPSHPANINFKSMQHAVTACKATGVQKVVRLTGLSVGLSPWSPISILFSILLSFSNMWNRRGEQVLRESGLDYTIVRPGGLKDDPPAKERGDKLLLGSESWGEEQPAATTGISRTDVAALLCLSLDDARLSYATLRVNRSRPGRAENNYFEDPRGKATWEELVPSVTRDTTPLSNKDYGTPVGVVLTALAAAVGYVLGFILGRVYPLIKASCGF